MDVTIEHALKVKNYLGITGKKWKNSQESDRVS
jgi:plasmid maintenance system antidote protein VapI